MASSTLGSSPSCMCSPPRARILTRVMWARTKEGVWPPWLLDPMSSTHNESRLAACPLSGVPGRVRAPCQLILGRVGKCAHLPGRVGQNNSQISVEEERREAAACFGATGAIARRIPSVEPTSR